MSPAAAIFGANMREARAHYAAQRDAIYDRWLRSDMSAIERDRRMSGVNVAEDATLKAEQDLYRLNRAQECPT